MKHKDTNNPVIFKRIHYTTDEEKTIVDAEVAIMKHAQSRHIMKFIESFAFETDLCIVMEYYTGGNLRKYMKALKLMTFKERKRVFFDTEGNVKTGDYGLTKQIVSKSYLKSNGTLMTYASYIWELGVIMIEMITGFNPFEGRPFAVTIENLINELVAELSDYIKGKLQDISQLMVEVNKSGIEEKRDDQVQYRKNKSEYDIDNILTCVAQKEDQPDITESDWIEIKKVFEIEEKGSEEQKKEI
ncbi:MAG: hypothetical protein EZS28_025802 [Streblomastix strix]|uniref:Protein kinase domain-containing protein n=1 Tax=Streblomastix strix TaxID=222440 RepID=A0A5J4V873_9EUKA|nr:MAG: hypothetical protein EZS28_025802 [Streblomastix strix]